MTQSSPIQPKRDKDFSNPETEPQLKEDTDSSQETVLDTSDLLILATNRAEQQGDRSSQSKQDEQTLTSLIPQTKGWKSKITAGAIAIAMLPVLAVGATTYYFVNQSIKEQLSQTTTNAQTELLQQRQLLTLLLMGTGATALLSGAIAAVFARRIINTAAAATKQESRTERTERTQLLTEVIYNIRASLNREDVLRATVEESRRVLACDRVLVYSLDKNSQGMVIAESVASGWPRALRAKIDDPCFSARYMEKYQNGRVQATDNIYEASLSRCYLEQLEPFQVKANLVVPLMNEGKLIGLLIAHQCSAPRAWQQTEIDLFVQIATQAGFALDNAKLLAEHTHLQKQVDTEIEWTRFLTEATQHLYDSLNQEDVLKAAVEEARRVLVCDRVVVYSVDRKSQGVIIAESVAPGWPRALGKTIKDPCFEAKYIEKYQNGRVRALDNIYEAGLTPCYIEQLTTLAVKANLVAPVLHEGKLLGLIVAHQCSEPRSWKPLEIRWFKQLAIQVGFALDNAKLLGRVNQMSQEAETTFYKQLREKETRKQQMSALLKDSEAALTDFSTEVFNQGNAVNAVLNQIQEIVDSARGVLTKAEQTKLQIRQSSQILKDNHNTVNLTLDGVTAIQETVTETDLKVKYLSQISEQLSQTVNFINNLAAQTNHQAMSVTIEAGRAGEVSQATILSLAETVRSFIHQLANATAKMENLIGEIDKESHDVAAAIEVSNKKAIAGTELVKKTRQQLNQIAALHIKMNSLLDKIVQTATVQTQISTSTSQSVIEVASLTSETSEKSTAVAKFLTKLATFARQL